ncbi:MAG: FprA family A-type flavoprotein [Halobacteriota archaeon]|nr:FprA family A-type flavoprotein [Halobacteriota archaeon]
MSKVELKDGIYWVGAIDWNLRDFHGYVTAKGTTYNSYLIVDEKIALVDTVKYTHTDEMLRRIRDIIDPKDIDYMIANHVEMDHSSSLTAIMDIAKDAKVVSTERGKEGFTKYYDCDWDFITVKSGDEIKLGKKTLTFLEAPMLHWPDSMFTYVKEDKVLLPNDGFGQHVATSKRFDDEVGDVMEDAATYYANILMPLSSLVVNKIDEVVKLGIEIEMICPSHGIIWRSDPGKIIEAYVKWGKGETSEKAVIVYDTMWGSTDKMAKAILEGISSEGVEVKLLKLRENHRSDVMKEVLDTKAVIVGSPTLNNGMFPTVADFLTYMKGLRPKNKIGAAFGSHGWAGGAVKVVEAELEAAKFEMMKPDLDFQFKPTEEELEKCFDFGKEIALKIKG